MLTITDLKKQNLIIFEAISGSRAYGLATPQSDTDIKGVFILPHHLFYGFEQVDQINNETNDQVYYELKKFLYLLGKSNPNVLEMLKIPQDCILYQDELFERIKPEYFLSQLCEETFANYALSQVKRARGLNKKIMNPIAKEKKTVLDFCYVTHNADTLKLQKWLEIKGYSQKECGLCRLEHFKDTYALFYLSPNQQCQGIVRKEVSNDVCISSIPKGQIPKAYLYFNRDGYMRYIKDYAEYWQWVKNRNENRYQSTLEQGKNYDAKNMMHTFRLLAMAEEIAATGTFNVLRPDRDKLLAIKRGEYQYDQLIEMAHKKIEAISQQFKLSVLPEKPDYHRVEQLLRTIRLDFYKRKPL